MQLTNFAQIEKKHRHIFLSPHLDDAVYCCGGTLGVQVSSGLRPLVITVFAGIPSADLQLSPFAQEIQRTMGFQQNAAIATTARRQEDASAFDHLQADYLWLDYLDAIYRGTPPYYTQHSELIGGDVHPTDLAIDKQLALDLVALQEHLPDAIWYAPLAIGRHVDHQLVSSAASRLLQRGATVNFYEDFPYVLKAGALDARLKELGGSLDAVYVEMSEMLHLRQKASEMYTSQVELNFDDKAAMYKAMQNYTHSIRPVQTVHLERYWQVRPS